MSRKGENIRKRKDGRWEGRYKKFYNEKGKIVYGSIYGRTYKEVKEKMHLAFTATTSRPPSRERADITFGELLELWQEANKVKLKGSTQNKYDNLIKSHIIPALGKTSLSYITTPIINTFLSQKLQNGRLDGSGGLSASYVRSISLVISSALTFAVNEGMCMPLKNRIRKPSAPKKEIAVLPREKQKELEKILCKKLDSTGIGIMISLYTGLRIGEICALSWDDIDFSENTLHVRHTVSRIKSSKDLFKTELILDTPKTLSSNRVIPISSVLLPLLLEYKNYSNSTYITSEKNGFISPRTYEARFHKLLKDNNIEPFNFHILRHTFATRCIEAGVDVKSLSEILGHSNVSITLNTYVHSSLEMKKLQLEKLAILTV